MVRISFQSPCFPHLFLLPPSLINSGRNGCGKSTLLRIVAESCCKDALVDTKDDGIVFTGQVMSPRGIRVAFVEQEPPNPSDITEIGRAHV